MTRAWDKFSMLNTRKPAADEKCVVGLAALAVQFEFGHGKCLAAFLVTSGFGNLDSVTGNHCFLETGTLV